MTDGKGKSSNTEELKKQVGKRIKDLRAAQGWNQQQLAKEADLTQSAIAQFENGERLPSTTALQSIAKAFKVSMEWLLAPDDGEDPDKQVGLEQLMNSAKELSTDQILTLNRLVEKFKPPEKE